MSACDWSHDFLLSGRLLCHTFGEFVGLNPTTTSAKVKLHPAILYDRRYKSPKALPTHLCFTLEKKDKRPVMANQLLLLLLLLTITTAATVLAQQPPYSFIQSEAPAPKLGDEKLTQLRFFWHDVLSGPNPTAVTVAQAASTNASSTYFGQVNVIDDPLTEGPEMASKLVGRAQGFYVSASQKDMSLLMAMNFAFMDGKYNGSTITILGRNAIFTTVREMSVVGGSGLFRLARGYVLAKTHDLDSKTLDAVVEYNCFIFHY